MNRRIGALGAIAILAVLALGISNASAASLSVTAGKLGVFAGAPRCVTGPLPVTVAGTSTAGSYYPQVLIDTVPAACNGKAIKLTVFGTGGSVLGTSQALATASTDTTTVTMTATYPGASVLGAALTIGGYGVTTTWTGPPPPATGVIVAGNRDTELTVGDWFTSGTLTCASVKPFVTEGNKTWRINVNIASAPFVAGTFIFTGQDANKVTTIIGAPTGWQFVGGISPYDKLQQIQDVPMEFNICG